MLGVVWCALMVGVQRKHAYPLSSAWSHVLHRGTGDVLTGGDMMTPYTSFEGFLLSLGA